MVGMREKRKLKPGLRRGENHPRATLTDGEVEMIRKLHEQGLGYKRIASKFECGVRTVRDIVSYRRR